MRSGAIENDTLLLNKTGVKEETRPSYALVFKGKCAKSWAHNQFLMLPLSDPGAVSLESRSQRLVGLVGNLIILLGNLIILF